MKIPKNSGAHYEEIRQLWQKTANEMALEYGIFIQVVTYYDNNSHFPNFNNITFEVMDHEFENLHDLRKAVQNKAFL